MWADRMTCWLLGCIVAARALALAVDQAVALADGALALASGAGRPAMAWRLALADRHWPGVWLWRLALVVAWLGPEAVWRRRRRRSPGGVAVA
mgnify:FL=1